MTRPVVWQVIWVGDDGRGHGACGHRHATTDNATACAFEPEGLPALCSGLVRQVRDPAYTAPEDDLARRRAPRQLELGLDGAR